MEGQENPHPISILLLTLLASPQVVAVEAVLGMVDLLCVEEMEGSSITQHQRL
jgi:hypothetical protein